MDMFGCAANVRMIFLGRDNISEQYYWEVGLVKLAQSLLEIVPMLTFALYLNTDR